MVPKAGNIISVDIADIDTMRANINVNSITESLLCGLTSSLMGGKLLALRRSYNHPIHFICDDNLTRQTRVSLNILRKVEHGLLHFIRRAQSKFTAAYY